MKAKNDVQITIRVDRELKENAENLFSNLGLNMSTALNVFLRKAVNERGIPFSLSENESFIFNKYTEQDISNAFKNFVQNEIEQKKESNTPVARYDKTTQKAFLEYPNGKKEFAN